MILLFNVPVEPVGRSQRTGSSEADWMRGHDFFTTMTLSETRAWAERAATAGVGGEALRTPYHMLPALLSVSSVLDMAQKCGCGMTSRLSRGLQCLLSSGEKSCRNCVQCCVPRLQSSSACVLIPAAARQHSVASSHYV